MFLKVVIETSDFASRSKGGMAPAFMTRSLATGPSPAMLPNAQTACSATCALEEFKSSTNLGIAFALITALVCSDVPEAMLVKAQQASNCKCDLK